jgi:hypothetical protein
MKLRLTFIVLFCQTGCLFSAAPAAADTAKQTAAKPVSEQPSRANSGEITLDEIDIQGAVEKPSVIIVPKRVEPDLKEQDLNRSFEQEVKEGAADIPKQDEPLRKVEPAPSIKKTIEKERD